MGMEYLLFPSLLLVFWVGAEDLEEDGPGLDVGQGLGHWGVLPVPLQVNQEKVAAKALLEGAGLNLGQVYLAGGELLHRPLELARAVFGEGEAEGGLVPAGGGMVVEGQDHEAGDVGLVVLDALGQDMGTPQLGCPAGADGGGGGGVLHHLLHRSSSGEGGHGLGLGEAPLQKAAALGQGLGMGEDGPYLVRAGSRLRQEVVLYGQDELPVDEDPGLVDKDVQGIIDRALDAVLNGHHPFIGHPRIHGGGYGGDTGEGDKLGLGAIEEGRLLGEGALGPQEGYLLGHLHPPASVSTSFRACSSSGRVTATTWSPAWRTVSGVGSWGRC